MIIIIFYDHKLINFDASGVSDLVFAIPGLVAYDQSRQWICDHTLRRCAVPKLLKLN